MSLNKTILLTGGLGDVIALESFISDEERNDITEIMWATRALPSLRLLQPINYVFPNFKNQIILYEDWAQNDEERKIKPWNLITKQDIHTKLKMKNIDLNTITDFSIAALFGEIKQNKRIFNKSKFIELDKKPEINIANNYIVIHPMSDNTDEQRTLNTEEWNCIIQWLELSNNNAIVINKIKDETKYQVPINSRIIDLTNKTSLLESIWIIKHASGFIGSCSSMSVIAARAQLPKMLLKGTDWLSSDHGLKMKFYYHPYDVVNNDSYFKGNDFTLNIEKVLDKWS